MKMTKLVGTPEPCFCLWCDPAVRSGVYLKS